MNFFTYIRNDEIIEFFYSRRQNHRSSSVKYPFLWREFWYSRDNNWTRQRNDGNKKQSYFDRANNLRIFHVSRTMSSIRIRVHTCIFLYPESFYFYSLQLRGAIRARSKQAQTNPRSPSNDKCFRSAVVIGGVALLNPIPIMPISASTMRRLLASFGREEGARKGVANTRPNKPRPMDLRSFRFPGIRGNRLPLYHPTVDFLRILERKLFRRIEIVFGIFWECFFTTIWLLWEKLVNNLNEFDFLICVPRTW